MDKLSARCYFDVISPFAYLHFKQLDKFVPALDIEFVPVLFAGLLKSWGTKGPAELPAKRTHTYRQCVWIAQQLGIRFTMPPRHPFNPLSALRLLIARGSQPQDIAKVLEFIWADGRDPETEWADLPAVLGIDDAAALVNDPAVKAKLLANTEAAAAAGVWGVPTIEVRGQLFWGLDTLGWLAAFVADPALFDAPGMRRAHSETGS